MIDTLIPVGSYTLTAAMDDRLRAAAAAPPRGASSSAHPIFGFVAAVGGLGRPIGDLCRGLNLAFDKGAVLASCKIAYARPLQVERTYDVNARVASLVRKPSRKYGAADHLTLAITIAADGEAFVSIDVRMVTPA